MKLFLSLAFTAGLLVAGATSASAMVAAPPPPALSDSAGVLQVRDGCGRDSYRNRHGRCVRDHRRGGDGCGRNKHRNRYGRCVRNW